MLVKCANCGQEFKRLDVELHVDHVIPLAKGGLDEEANLTVACQDCNLGKSSMIIEY